MPAGASALVAITAAQAAQRAEACAELCGCTREPMPTWVATILIGGIAFGAAILFWLSYNMVRMEIEYMRRSRPRR